MVCFRYLIVNTLHTGDNKDNNNNNNNNGHKSCICQAVNVKVTVLWDVTPFTDVSAELAQSPAAFVRP